MEGKVVDEGEGQVDGRGIGDGSDVGLVCARTVLMGRFGATGWDRRGVRVRWFGMLADLVATTAAGGGPDCVIIGSFGGEGHWWFRCL
jgi:hypothetical protein